MVSRYRFSLFFHSLVFCLALIPNVWAGHALASPLHFPDAVAEIQAGRDGLPLWVTPSGWTPLGQQLLKAISLAETEGLDSADYHYPRLEPFASTVAAPGYTQQQLRQSHAQLEELLTDAYLKYALDLAGHQAHTVELPEKWVHDAPFGDVLPDLIRGLMAEEVNTELDRFRPRSPAYQNLCQALRQERARLNEESPAYLSDGPALKLGLVSSRVFQLRETLRFWGDMNAPTLSLLPLPDLIKASTFDRPLARVVKKFQARHGLEADGIVGSRTLVALNRSPQQRVAQIRLNLERLRWMPRDLGDKYIQVNIPDFSLAVFQDEKRIFATKAIVGMPKRPTPILSAKIASLVVNPYWNVPQKLAREDLLPKVRKDPEYLIKKQFNVYENWVPGAPALDLNLMDWESIQPWDMAYKFQQNPGPHNPLGRVKFMFSNPFSVFLHDTNSKGGFNRTQRTLSSGCIRVEKPLELANILMNTEEGSSSAETQFEELIASGENRYLRLAEKVPVHLMYLTSWVDEKGVLNFREDIYGYDSPMMMALNRSVPEDNEEMLASAEKGDEESRPATVRFTNSELVLYPHE